MLSIYSTFQPQHKCTLGTGQQETSSSHPQVGPLLYYTSRNKLCTSPSGPLTVLHIKKQVLYIPKWAPHCTTHQQTSSVHPQVGPLLYYTSRNKFSTSPSGPPTVLHTNKQVLYIPKWAPHCTTHQETSTVHPQVGPLLYYTSRNKFCTSPSGPNNCTTHQETSSVHPQGGPTTVLHTKKQVLYIPKWAPDTTAQGPRPAPTADCTVHCVPTPLSECCVVLCCVLCCVMLCCVVLCCVVCCVVLCCVVLCCVVLCCVVLCCAVLRCVVLCCVVLCCLHSVMANHRLHNSTVYTQFAQFISTITHQTHINKYILTPKTEQFTLSLHSSSVPVHTKHITTNTY